MKRHLDLILALVGGVLFALAFPTRWTTSLFPSHIIGMSFLLWTVRNYLDETINGKRLAMAVLLFSLGASLVGHHWIPYTLSEFGQIGLPWNYLLAILFAVIAFPHLWAFALVLRLLRRKFPLMPPLMRVLIISVIFTLLEYFVPQQFPSHMGHPWAIFAPYIGGAPVFGVPLFSFMSMWLAWTCLIVVTERRLDIYCALALPVFIIANAAFPLSNQYENGVGIKIRLVQANIGNFMKLQSEKGDKQATVDVVTRYRLLSTDKNTGHTDLIIWPETAFPFPVYTHEMQSSEEYIPPVFHDIMDATGSAILFGGYDQRVNAADSTAPDFEQEYNAAILLRDEKMSGVYHKHKLIPFGETLPVGPLRRPLSALLNNMSFFAEGDSYTFFRLHNGATFITPICYEVLFPEYMRSYMNGAEERPHFMVNLTNDSWYGNSSEPYQHLFLAKWRALEFQIPLVRATNTGISSVSYPDGTESVRIGIGETRAIDVSINVADGHATLFQRAGILMMFLLWMIVFLVQVMFGFGYKPFSKKTTDL